MPSSDNSVIEILNSKYLTLKPGGKESFKNLVHLIERSIKKGAVNICIDVSGFTNLQSDGIRFIIIAHKRMEKTNGKLAILAGEPSIRSLTMMGLNKILFLASDKKLIDEYMSSK